MPAYVTLQAQRRSERGSNAARRLRRQGWLPAVLYNERGETLSLCLERHALEMVLRQHASGNLIADLVIDSGDPRRVLLRELQHDPVTDALLHADFVELSMTHKMRIHVPVELTGTAVGVHEGGLMHQLLRSLEVECLPGDLIETLPVDVSAMKIGDTLRVADLKLPPGVRALTPGGTAVATIAALKAEEAAAAEAATPGAEPEVIATKGKAAEEAAESVEKSAEGGGGAKVGKPETKAPAKDKPKG